jgi:RNA polymerase sigma-70 factor (ECF subfamily)
VLLRLPLPESDEALVAALRAGRVDAREEIVRRCAPDVERVLYRILGPDPEIEDVAHEVFMTALASVGKIRQPDALRSWLVGIAVRKVRKLIRRRERRRFVMSVITRELRQPDSAPPPAELSEALRSTYRIFERIPADDRVAFALRFVDGMALADIAEATGVSLATAKRRIFRARQRFVELAKKSDLLEPWIGKDELES